MSGSFDRRVRRAARSAAQQPDKLRTVATFDRTKLTALEALQKATRLAGCTCEPDFYETGDGVHFRVAHDSWCVLIRGGDAN